MALILSIETATSNCSVALSNGTEILSLTEENSPNIHASALTVFIESTVKNCGYSLNDLDAIAVSKGPGSYTGLRIGVSTAKGLCYAIDKPLIAVNTLKAMAKGFQNQNNVASPALLCPMIDARRMEVFMGIYREDLTEYAETTAAIINEQSFDELLQTQKMIFFGNGAEKCKQVINSPNAVFIAEAFNSAANLALLALEKFERNAFENVAYFEPFYLKDFVSTQPKK